MSIVDGFQVQIADNIPQWSDLVDVDGTKIMLERTVMKRLSYPEYLQGEGSNGVLLYGPPGCGKTVLVHSMVRECSCSFLAVGMDGLMSKWQGHTEKIISTLITKAKAIQPCIIFIDEVDALAKHRYDGVASARSIFLNHWWSLQGTNVIVVGATNMPETIDGAFLRRFDTLIPVGLPGEDARLELLKTMCGKRRCNLSDHEIEHLAVKSTHGLTCDEIIKEVRDLACLLGIEVVSAGYFVKIDTSTNGAVYEPCPMNTAGAIYLPDMLERRRDVTVQRRPVNFERLEEAFIEKLGFVEADRFVHFNRFTSTHAKTRLVGRNGINLV